MQNYMVMFTFYVFDWKCTFWENIVSKLEIIGLRWNLVPRLTQIYRNNSDVHFSCFKLKLLWSKKKWKLFASGKFSKNTDSMVIHFLFFLIFLFFFFFIYLFIFFISFRMEILFPRKFCTKIQTYFFKLKFAIKPNSNMQNSIVVLTFSFLEWNYSYWPNLLQKIKNVNLSWFLV